MEQWQIEGLDKLERHGYIPVLRALAQGLTAPFWWYDPGADIGTSIKHNGTIFFVNTGTQTIGVTASHVYSEYLKDKHARPSLKCQIGHAVVEPDRYIIDNNESLDLATFAIPEFLISASGGSIHHPQSWPPPPLETGEIVMAGGFLGHLRTEKETKAEFPFVSFIGRVGQHSDNHATIYLNIPNSYWPAGESLEPSPDLGGMSGGPVYRIREGIVDSVEIAGFIYQYSPTFELMRARLAVSISADGHIP